MEASRFGFGHAMPPAFKFDPTDDDIVAHYLLPRALGDLNPPFPDAVINANPASLPPPDLLALHGHPTSHHALFLDMNGTGGRRGRDIKGGVGGLWRGQQGNFRTVTLLRPGGAGEVDIVYKRYDLTYKGLTKEEEEEEEDARGRKKKKKKKKRKTEGPPSGWIMHEYTIVSPPLQSTVLSRIKLSKNRINNADHDQPQADLHQHHQVVPAAIEQPAAAGPSYYQDRFPNQEQPGPSHRHDFTYQEQAGPSHRHDVFPGQEQPGPSHRHDFSYQEQAGPSHHRHDFQDHEQAGPSHRHDDFPGQEQPGPSHRQDFSYQEQPGPSHRQYLPYQQQRARPSPSNYNLPNPMDMINMLCAGEGFAGHNAYQNNDLLVMPSGGGGQGLNDGSQALDASLYGGGMPDSYLHMILGPEDGFDGDNTYHHQPLDVTCGGGGEGFDAGSQADVAPCNGDNGGGMGDGTSCAGKGFAGGNTYHGNTMHRNDSSASSDIEFSCPADDQKNSET